MKEFADFNVNTTLPIGRLEYTTRSFSVVHFVAWASILRGPEGHDPQYVAENSPYF